MLSLITSFKTTVDFSLLVSLVVHAFVVNKLNLVTHMSKILLLHFLYLFSTV